MKKISFLRKTLLVAAGLLVGASNAWAATVTETYDFGTFMYGNSGNVNLTVSGGAIAQSGTSEKIGSVYLVDNPTNSSSVTLDLNGRFAVDYPSNASSKIRFLWRNGSAYQLGLCGNWNNNGTADAQGVARISILKLKASDKITITYSLRSGKGVSPKTCKADFLTGLGVDEEVVSGTEYTVAADGNLDLYISNDNIGIQTVVIKTEGTETMGAPTIAATGANGGQRTITITPGEGNAGSDATATYYTTDGSDPSSSNGTAYTAPFTIETTTTIKAVSYLGETIGEIASKEITAGTTLQLNAPSYTIGAYSEGSYTLTLTSTQSSVIGAPTATISYNIDGGAEQSVASGTAVIVAVGSTITMWSVASGYTNSENTIATPSYIDFSTFATLFSTDFKSVANTLLEGESNTSLTLTKGDELVSGYYKITNTGFDSRFGINNVDWQVRYYGATKAANTGLWPYNVKGYMAIANLKAGSVVVFNATAAITARANVTKDEFMSVADGSYVFVVNSDGTAEFTPTTSSYIYDVTVYVPKETKTVTVAGYATYCSTNALDFTSVDGLTAYQITGASGATLTLSEITGTVAANTGILLAGAAGNYTIPVVATGTDYSSTNKLVGVTAETAKAAGTIYVLMNETPGVGFYENNKAFTVGANTAYLNVSDFAAAREFFLFGETTGINQVETAKKNVEGCYNLNGQRVAQPTKGLYIVNGKKVIIK